MSSEEIALRERIPNSVLPFPKGIYNRSKYVFWKVIYPLHNTGRDVLLDLGIIHHKGRQDYLLGKISSDRTFGEFVKYLVDKGWWNHFIAWDDDDQVLSVRKLVNFEWQYHLRVFSDGEVRGHYEYTPESHPIWHVKSVRQEHRPEVFMDFLDGWVVPASAAPAVHED